MALRIHSERAEPRDVLRAGEELRRDRATRSRASIAIAVVGIIDIVSAAMPPLRERLSLMLHIVPLAVPQLASALVGLSGLALLGLAWSVRKGQRQAWTISMVLLIGTAVLHLLKGVELTEGVLPLLILAYLVSGRHAFQTVGRSALATVRRGVARARDLHRLGVCHHWTRDLLPARTRSHAALDRRAPTWR